MFKKNKMIFAKEMPAKGIYCVYLLVCDSKGVVYVGQTSDLEGRMKDHVYSDKQFDRFEYRTCHADSRDALECFNIIKYNPELNKRLPPTDDYVSLALLKAILTEDISSKLDDLIFSLPRAFDRGDNKSKMLKYITTQDAESLTAKFNKLFGILTKANK